MMGDVGLVQDFIFLCLILIKRIRSRVSSRFSCVILGMERLSLHLPPAVKKQRMRIGSRVCVFNCACGEAGVCKGGWVLGS